MSSWYRAAALALLQAGCASPPAPKENTAILVASSTVRIVQVDGKKVCAFGGLITSALGCPESAELTPGHHVIEVASYLNQTSASGTIEIDARPQTSYTVGASIKGYSASFHVEENPAN